MECSMPSGRIEIALPECPKGLGHIISRPGSPDLIEGVRIQPLQLWPDDRGCFFELYRLGQALTAEFPAGSIQISAAVNFPGTIKAFHYHREQTDCFTPVRGLYQIALVDLRKDSPTFGRRNTIYAGELRPWQVLIPRGVGHGYKVLGTETGVLVYATDRFYNPEDEGRIPYDHPGINYDWATQHK
ncbi:MAG: dTDP-4-dehydrorhamnose 3,5-epimerase family protein [Bryobacteraceae bacterium]|nr:dTDP-4-dehydrorhamnose 3,5-epimerase family protein [Bryobacteraceae bacterium]